MRLSACLLALWLVAADAKPYSKVIKEVEEWGVIPHGLIVDKTENTHLEDFYQTGSIELRSNAKKLVRNLSLGLALPPGQSRVSAEEFYDQAVANLKTEMPQLRWVKFYDGYTYFPENGTSEQLENELVYLKHHLQRVTRILHKNGLDVEEESEFYVNMLFNKDVVMKSRFLKVLSEEYGYKTDLSKVVGDCMVRLHPQLDNFRLKIEINFVEKLSPFIRSDYPKEHALRHTTFEAITQGRISSRIAGVLFSTLMGSPPPFLQCRI